MCFTVGRTQIEKNVILVASLHFGFGLEIGLVRFSLELGFGLEPPHDIVNLVLGAMPLI